MKKAPTNPTPLEEISQKFNVERIPAPTRLFAVGDSVSVGGYSDAVIDAVWHAGKFYSVSSAGRGDAGPLLVDWLDVWPAVVEPHAEILAPDDVRYRMSSLTLDGLLLRVYHFGVNDSPSYQRGHVWSLDMQVRLIETLFDRGGIGAFSFNKLPYADDQPSYEVVDGKQRLRALCHYWEGRFPVRGSYIHELSRKERYHFINSQAQVYDIEEGDRISVLKLFLRLNRGGTPVDEAHIESVREELAGLLA